MKSKFFRILALLSLFLFLFIQSCEPPTEAEKTGDIVGVIYDASNSQPLSGATITTDPTTSSKISDANGNYSIKGIDPGDYTVQVSKLDYHTNSTSIQVVVGEEASADIQLLPHEPELSVSNKTLNFGTVSNNLTFNINNSGIGTLNYNITFSANWLSINPTSGSVSTETDVITVTVNRDGIAPGNYFETINITSNSNSETIDIMMTIPDPNNPQISVTPPSLDFGKELLLQKIYISNSGSGMLSWNLSSNKSWISINNTSGTTEDETDEVEITISRLGLDPGTYNGIISVTSDGGNQNINLVMIVPDEPTLSVSPVSLDFGSNETILPLSIANAGAGDLTWSVSDNQEWISLDPSSGVNFSTVNVSVSRNDMNPGNYSGSVTISSNAGIKEVPISMNVPQDAPPTPVILENPTDITHSSIKLAWNVNSDNDFISYNLYRNNNSSIDENSTLITKITNRYQLDYTDESLNEGTQYYYVVFVEDAGGNTSASNIVNATTTMEPGTWGVFQTLESNIDLYDIDVVDDNFAVAVGDSGRVYFFDGISFKKQEVPTKDRLYAVAAISKNNIYIAGREGVYNYNGSIWNQPPNFNPGSTCRSIGYADENNVWIGGEEGEIWHFNGSEWLTINTEMGSVKDIKMKNNNEGWAIGNNIYKFNGTSWSFFDDHSGYGILAFSETNVYIATYYSVNFYNGDNWKRYSLYARCIDGISSSDFWTMGYRGNINHFDGSEFTKINNPTSEDINGLKILSIRSGWAVCDSGIVLRYN